MTTAIPGKQDGSPASRWIGIKYKIDTPSDADWRRQDMHIFSMSGDRNYLIHGLMFGTSDGCAMTEAQAEFDRLAAEWKHETEHLSSSTAIVAHRAYQEIIGMGREAIPMILRDLEGTQAQWFSALRSIARESPIQPEDRGDIGAMAAAWLKWGKQRQYI